MTHSLYTKFVLGYLLFGLLGFVLIATFSSHMTHEYLVRERSDAMYDEANLLASTYSDIYQGKTISLDTANPQLEAVSTYLGASAWVLDHKGAVVAETSPASHSGKTIEGFDPTVTGNKSGTSSTCSPARPYRYWPPSPEISIHTAMWCSTCPWSGSWTARTRS